MCGITGIYSVNSIKNIQDRILRMNASIIHRGPDSAGFYHDNNLALGHRRLSIIDTREVSNQPMHSNKGSWHIVFNGEIYNFEEIRQHLKYNFKTKFKYPLFIFLFFFKIFTTHNSDPPTF